jgi:hypothetical protein
MMQRIELEHQHDLLGRSMLKKPRVSNGGEPRAYSIALIFRWAFKKVNTVKYRGLRMKPFMGQ